MMRDAYGSTQLYLRSIMRGGHSSTDLICPQGIYLRAGLCTVRGLVGWTLRGNGGFVGTLNTPPNDPPELYFPGIPPPPLIREGLYSRLGRARVGITETDYRSGEKLNIAFIKR